jgi:Holliday junction resolvasome RuvABC endonuclease subunit
MAEKVFDGGLLPGPVAIGIDQSLTGFAVTALNVGRPECYETWVYKSSYRGIKRLVDIRHWLQSKLEWMALQGYEFHDIAMEGMVLKSQFANAAGELTATVKLTLWDHFEDTQYEHCRTPIQIPPTTVKKYATGKGNAKKQEMLMQIYKRYGVEFNDDNAADSYAIARMASGSITSEIEKTAIELIQDPKFRDSL